MTTLVGRLGSQYSLSAVVDQPGDAERFRLQLANQIFNNPITLWTGEYSMATKIMDFCQQHDGLAIDAAQKLYGLGDPTALLDLVEQAKTDPQARARKRVTVGMEIQTDILESEDAIIDVSQRMSAAARMCGVSVKSMTCDYSNDDPSLVTEVGIAYCWKSVEKALEIKYLTGSADLSLKVDTDKLARAINAVSNALAVAGLLEKI
jgi:hypothetical protein